MPLEDPGDDGPNGPPPDPLDRLWVHPSELSTRSRPVAGSPARRRNRGWLVIFAAGATGAIVAIGILAVAGLLGSDDPRPETSSGAPVAVLAARAAPAVVAVVAATGTGERRGSGVVIADGWVLATCGTLGDAGTATVASDDGSQHGARVRGLDPTTDLALLRVDGMAGALTMPSSDRVTVGEPVIAIGAGDGSTASVATGVVSSVTTPPTGEGMTDTSPSRTGRIATDALVDEDATGGVLLDAAGHVVGVIITGAERGGVAVPIAVARGVADELRRTGKAGHGWMGVGGSDALERSDGGVRVVQVEAGGPADRAGIRVDDVIVAIGGATVRGMADLVDEVRSRKPGGRVTVGVRRDGQRRTFSVILRDMPPEAAASTTTTTGAVTALAG